MNAHLRATCILLIMYAHHMTSESHDVRIYARVVHFNRVMQQGDCNAPSTFQRLMTSVFHDFVMRFVHVYLDNIFIYSSTIKGHENHLAQVFNKLREAQLYPSQDKVDLYSERMDCLGHIITNPGIHACADKMQKIWDW